MNKHNYIINLEVSRFANRRIYQMYNLDQSQFELMNTGGMILGINGYCLDAPEEVPSGCMVNLSGPTLHTVARGVTMTEQQAMDDMADKLIEEILSELNT